MRTLFVLISVFTFGCIGNGDISDGQTNNFNHNSKQTHNRSTNHKSTNSINNNEKKTNNTTHTNKGSVVETTLEQNDKMFTVATYHSIGVYWSPAGGEKSKEAHLSYKLQGDSEWIKAYPMKYNPVDAGINPVTKKRFDKADYRASLVHLKPNTDYYLRLELEGQPTVILAATTWSENPPIGKTIKINSQNEMLEITESGTKDAYVLYDGTGATIDVEKKAAHNILIKEVKYVIVRGLTLKNAKQSAIQFDEGTTTRFITIEDMDISAWGRVANEDLQDSGDDGGNPYAVDYEAAIYNGWDEAAVVSSTFQRNKIHDPTWGSNSWIQDKHPEGPQGISLGFAYEGNIVIRYNEFWSSPGHYFNDVIGLGHNNGYEGSPGPDSDIYGNYISDCFDDGIEAEGSGANVRIWNNYINNTYLGIGNASVSIGPLYIWRNVFDQPSIANENNTNRFYGPVIKAGDAGDDKYMTGYTYFFHNTILQREGRGYGGLGVAGDGGRPMKYFLSRNNIVQVREDHGNSISDNNTSIEISYDWDLLNKAYPDGHEVHGMKGKPTYAQGAPSFDEKTKSGNFTLDPTSLGYTAGENLEGFSGPFEGKGPDVGAHQHGKPNKIYGVKAQE